MVPAANKPTIVTKFSTTIIDYIMPNVVFENDFKSVIVKNDNFDHFSIIFPTK